MSKKGMKRPETTHTQPKDAPPVVPEIQGKAKSANKTANPIIAGTNGVSQKAYHSKPYKAEKPISKAYPEIDTDLARDNIENDLTEADKQ